MSQTKHETEVAAREAARKLGVEQCQIVQSKTEGQNGPGPWVFYVESGKDMTLIRHWERIVHDGSGNRA